MKRVFVFPQNYFQSILDLLTESPHQTLYCEIGIGQQDGETQYLVRSAKPIDSVKPPNRYICVSTASVPIFSESQIEGIFDPDAVGHLVLGREEQEGYWWGYIFDGVVFPLSQITLVGPEMTVLTIDSEDFSCQLRKSVLKRWSRTIGALGKQTWQRIIELSIAVIGCGRSGSIAAVTLAKMGAKNLILVDPDKIELYNIPEMDGVKESDIGKYKAEVVAGFIKDYCVCVELPLSVKTYTQSIVSAYRKIREADVLVCCVDNDTARLACGIIATLYHKVLLEIGTGIMDMNGERLMGGDIRLIIPGNGCLRCFGNLVDYDAAINALARLSKPENNPWWISRLGSLRMLNMIAVHTGLQLLCDFIGGVVQESRWVHLECNTRGETKIEYRQQRADNLCPLCIKSGMGDDGIGW